MGCGHHPSISHWWGDRPFPMAHRVGLGPGGPVLFQTILEPPRLLCSILDCSGGNLKGLDLTGCNALKYSFIELWENVAEPLVPVPTGFYNVPNVA